MKISNLALTLAIGSLALGCVISDDDADGSGTTTDGSATGTTNTTPGMTMTQTGTNTNGQTGDTTEGPSTATDDTGMTDSGTTAAVDPGPFVEDDPDPSLYTQVDRMGMPVVTSALISCNDPDPMADDCNDNDYNEAGRTEDLANTWIADISDSVGDVRNGLLAELTNDPMDPTEPGLGLTACSSTNACVTQAGPLIIPDTLKLNLGEGAGFPNGRGPADQVVDITLAAILLDLGTHPVDLFASVPVSPPENDLPFEKAFPFLAAAH